MAPKPVLGMVLKGYPRISETFISNEILLLETLGVSIHIFSMRRPRESFSHASVKRIKAAVDYLPHELLRPIFPLLYHNMRLALKRPAAYRRALAMACARFRRTRKSATIKHLLQAGYLVRRFLPGTGVTHLHAHFAHSPTSVAMFASILSGLPFSFTAHAKDIYTSNPRQLAEKIRLARFVVTCTGYNRDHLEALLKRAETGAALSLSNWCTDSLICSQCRETRYSILFWEPEPRLLPRRYPAETVSASNWMRASNLQSMKPYRRQ